MISVVELTAQELAIADNTVLIIRVITVLLGGLGVALMIVLNLTRHRRAELTSFGQTMTRVGVTMMFLAVSWGTIEAHVYAVPPAPRMFVLLGALIWADIGLVASLWEQRRGIWFERHTHRKD